MCKTPVYGTVVVPLLQHLYLLFALLLVGLALLFTLQPLHGDVSELVVEDLLCNGSSLLSSVVQRVAEKLEERSTTQKEPQGRYSLSSYSYKAILTFLSTSASAESRAASAHLLGLTVHQSVMVWHEYILGVACVPGVACRAMLNRN